MKIRAKVTYVPGILKVFAKVRYWGNTYVNGVEDTDGDKIPCRNGDLWTPEIDLNTGIILNWKQGTTADIHYELCDAGSYSLYDIDGNLIASIKNDYVPEIMYPEGEGYGDYIIMKINQDGFIVNFKPVFRDFFEEYQLIQ